MHQIAACFARPVDGANMSESVHGKWFKTGGVALSPGGAVAFDLIEAVQSQVFIIPIT
jgi:hypothetical protein